MDEDRPPSLVNVCVLCVCQNLDTLCSVCDDGSLRLRSCPVFPPELSDLLLSTMTEEGLLNDRTLGIFYNVECLRLMRACIRGSRLSAASFRHSLCSHRLLELNASHVLGDITISDILQGLSSNLVCRQSLQRLSVSGVDHFCDVSVSFRTLQGLRSLSVAWTPLDDSALKDICSLPLLESLDISGTNITDLTPLLWLRCRLRSLTLHALHHLRMAVNDFLSVISELQLLTHLDVSNDQMQTGGEMIRKLLQKTHILPALMDLDVSGWKGISDEALKTFLKGRTRMRFVGLLATGAGRSDFLSGERNLKVAGEWNLPQLCEALRRYRERESFLQEALLCLYKHLSDVDIGCRPDVLKLVYLGMKAHSRCVSVQVSGSACVFNLTSLELAEGMSQSLLGNVMRHIITTMRNFPDHKQIQKNCLLTLCSNYILDVVSFNRCEAAKQVMMCLISNHDETLQSLCASVIVVLMSRLSQEEITQLGAEEFIMKHLLHVVQQKASMGLMDNILEGTLTALWGLTDETHPACTHFLQCEGLELYKELLETYYLNPSVLKKILGLLNNVSEMEDLRVQLMDEELLQLLLILMEVQEVEVSYLAGGFLANVTSGSTWNLDMTLRHEILSKLDTASTISSPKSLSAICSAALGSLGHQTHLHTQSRGKREVSKAKQKAYEELYTRLDTREGQKDLYRLARQRDRDGKDVQQVRVIKDRDGRVLTSEESVQRRWKECFEELMNEENEREKRVEGVNSVEQKVDKIRKDEVRKALKRMKSGKAVGPDDIPVEVWKCLGEAAVEFLTSLFNRVLESERMPVEWRRSVLVPIFKNKGDVQSCSNYRGIKLMSHTMKLWERVVEARLRKVVEICEQQYGFMPRKSTTDAIFALRILMEKYRDGQRELHCVFVDLEKAYDRVPREELWYCMRKSGVAEKYVRVVQDMYERSRTVVRCAVGQTEEFNVEVGLHQGSALSPFLFAMVMDQLSEEVRQESPWTMMFADDIVICSESREQVEENLERWRFALERRGMKVSGSKTEYMCVNEREGNGTVRLQGEEVKKVLEFKYLGSTVQSNGECGKEVKKRVQAGWNGWRKVWGVLCERKISARIKGKVYRTVVRAAMLYGLETVSLRKRQESELEVAELKML
ncbi:hypothetical protein QTP70_026172, partial [Hemibagrus guttatus]